MNQKQEISKHLDNAVKKWIIACIDERIAKMDVDAISSELDKITGPSVEQIKLSVVKNENRI